MTDRLSPSSADAAATKQAPFGGAPPFLVAGVGASAGGLEAFKRLIQPIPADAPLALVFVQHLSRDHESFLPELVAPHTALRIEDGADGKRLEPGHLYVIRPDTQITVIDGVLRVRQREQDRALDAPIDQLFESMAEGYGEKAVGVLLSGAGRDGSAGLQKIRGVGGITMAQEPAQAQVDGMPRAAISTGAVELVLPAEQIADELVRLAEHPFFRQGAASLNEEVGNETVSRDEVAPVLQLLRRETGVDFGRYKQPTVQRRIRRRMALHRLTNVAEYVQLIRSDREEAEKLHDDILINVTSFFRDPGSFDALRSHLEPVLRQRREGTPIRAWVPGCSSGEEAYSLAITLIETLGEEFRHTPLMIFGTDLSQRMIDRARTGCYPKSIASEVPPQLLERYFSELDEGYRVETHVRERCVFARQDITRDPPFSKLDVVLCRNLLIYLGQPAQAKVINVFHYALGAGGTLMLGRSETVGGHADLFSLMDARWKIYRRQPGSLPAREVEFQARSVQFPSETRPHRISVRSPEQELQTETNRLLLDRFAPPAIVIDSKFTIVRSQGPTAAYLELPSGEVSLDVIKMIRPGLMSPLRNAIQDAREQDAPVRKPDLEFVVDGVVRRVSLEVKRVGRPENRHFLILFDEGTPTRDDQQATPPTLSIVPPDAPLASAVTQLQQELADSRVHLQSMIQELETANEELQAANEEILSSNEELQSTNEELDTAREELQSSNEELSTVNDELQSRNVDLSRSNSDLLNLLASVQIPIVMVTADLRVRMFTPAAERLLNLISADLGRPIAHIKPNVRYPDLEQVMREVIDTVTMQEREVEDTEGNTYIARVRPYKSVDHRIDGAVLALFDVTSTLKTAREAGEAIMSTVRDPILLLDSDLIIRRSNGAFERRFGIKDVDARERSVFELGGGQWNIPALRSLLLEVLPARQNFESFLVEHDFDGVGKQRLLLDGRRIESDRKGGGVILLILRDFDDGHE